MLKTKKKNMKPIDHKEFGKIHYNVPVEVVENKKVKESDVFSKGPQKIQKKKPRHR